VRARFPNLPRTVALLLLALLASLGVAASLRAAQPRDLARDEKRGGHTLSRHVGLTDAQLRERLKKDDRISAASTWTDRATAERVIAAALTKNRTRIAEWTGREGTRANLVIDWPGDGKVVGRSLKRGAKEPVPCTRALVVLRWDLESEIYYVLTSYPEASK
jgi:hypothetical protein